MSGEPSGACRRSARLAAKRAEAPRVDDHEATPSRPAVEADAIASTSGCQSTVKKRNVTDVEKPKRGRKKTTLSDTSPKRDEAVATKSTATAKRQRARAELASSEPSRQAKRIRWRSRSTSRSSQVSEGVASSGGSYHTAEEIASDAGSTTPEQEDDTLPTPPAVEVDTKFDTLRRVWRWLSSNDGVQSGVTKRALKKKTRTATGHHCHRNARARQ
ncbi:hypothetical protein MTO96_009480 [Rhipicephalus appendiculatus]